MPKDAESFTFGKEKKDEEKGQGGVIRKLGRYTNKMAKVMLLFTGLSFGAGTARAIEQAARSGPPSDSLKTEKVDEKFSREREKMMKDFGSYRQATIQQHEDFKKEQGIPDSLQADFDKRTKQLGGEMDKLSGSAELDSGSAEESREMLLKGMTHEANNYVDRAAQLGASEKMLELFQQAAFELAKTVVEEGGTMDDYKALLERLYEKAFGRLEKEKLPQTDTTKGKPVPVQKETASQTETAVLEAEVSEQWLWDNAGKVFFNDKGDTIKVVAKGNSADAQVAINKAELDASSLIYEYVRQKLNLPPGKPIDLRFVMVEKQIYRRLPNGRYEAAVLVRMPLAENLQGK